MKKYIAIREICFIGVFAATMAAVAPVAIPILVPVTLQTFVIMLAGIILGAKNGTIATIVYVLIGAVGVPVFAGVTGGFGIIAGVTGGFIISFPLLALCAGIGGKHCKENGKIWLFAWLAIGVTVNYLCGLLWFNYVTGYGLWLSLSYSVLPFVPADIAKIILAAIAGAQIKNALIKGKVLI